METFSVLLVLCEGNPPVIGGFPSHGPWRGALMFSLIWAWTNCWANTPVILRRHRAHYDVTAMKHWWCWDPWALVCCLTTPSYYPNQLWHSGIYSMVISLEDIDLVSKAAFEITATSTMSWQSFGRWNQIFATHSTRPQYISWNIVMLLLCRVLFRLYRDIRYIHGINAPIFFRVASLALEHVIASVAVK